MAAMVIAACGGKRSTSDDDASVKPKVQRDLSPGLDLRVANGKAGAPAYDRSVVRHARDHAGHLHRPADQAEARRL